MKRYAFIAALALGFGFTACDSFDEPNPPAQSNPQEPTFNNSEVTVTASSAATAPQVDLGALNDASEDLDLCTVVAPDVPSGYEVMAVMEISKDNTFSKTYDVETSTTVNEDGTYTIYVAPDALSGQYAAHISKSPKAATIYYRIRLYLQSGNTVARIGDPDLFYDVNSMNILPLPSTFVIENNYYLVGTINGWRISEGVKFDHSDADPYDDPVFTLVVDIPAADAESGWWWKIVPESVYVTGDWGSGEYSQFGPVENGDEALEGMLTGNDPGAGCIKESGPHLITINMEESTYKFMLAIPNLWTPGDANGWNAAASQVLFTNDYTTYLGFARLSPNGFKFTSQPNWDGINFGAGDADGVLSTDGQAGNLMVDVLGLYWCSVNVGNLTYSVDLISTIGIIGDFNGWSGSVAMTPSDDLLTWEVKDVDLTEGGGWKFRCNDDWVIDLGGEPGALVYKGDNIPVTESGTYDIVLHLDQLPYSATLTKK